MPHSEGLPARLEAAGTVIGGSTELKSMPVTKTRGFAGLRLVGRLGLAATAVAAVTMSWFIGNTTIAGAVVSTGILVVDSGAKPVQHPSGGVVASVLVRNGDRVVVGQPVVQLDQSVAATKLASATTQLLQNQVRIARLVAERDELDAPRFEQIARDPAISVAEFESIIRTERDQFSRRHDELTGQLSQLDEQISQAQAQAKSNEVQLGSIQEQRQLLERQLADLRPLYEQKLVPYSRISEAELALVQAKGTEGSLQSSILADKGKLAELRVTKIQVSRTWRAQVAAEIAQVQSASAQLAEQAALVRDQIQRSTIRASQDGIVHELAALSSGTVIQPAEKLMLIVPDHDKLVGEVKIRPGDIDQLYPGQSVTIQFSAFERATTPSVEGRLAAISADLVEDQRNGSLYYTARIEPDTLEALTASGLTLVPGMPVEAFIKTEDRTILSFLTKPLFDQANRAFR
jgi:HlyD family secretion protein